MAESKKEPFDYESLKESLEDAIKNAKPKKKGIELHEDFYEVFHCKITNRVVQDNKDPEDKDEVIWENNNQYENLDTEERSYKFSNSYIDHSCSSLTVTKGWSIGVGGKLGVEGMGAAAGVNSTGQYDRRTTKTEGDIHEETKTLETTGETKPYHASIVKELAYRETRYRTCDMTLSANKNSDVPYYFKRKTGKNKIKIKMRKLIKHLSKTNKQFNNEGDQVTFRLNGRCKFTCVKHALRSSQVEITSPPLRMIEPSEKEQHNSKTFCRIV